MWLKCTLLHFSGSLRRVPPYPRTVPPITLFITMLLGFVLLVCVSEKKGEKEERVRVYMIYTCIHICMYICIFRNTFMYISIHAHIFIDTCVYIYDLYTYKHICIYIWIHKKQRCFHIDRCNGFSNGCPSVNWRGGVFEIGGWLHRWYCPYFDQYVCGHGRYASTRTHTHTHVHLCVCVCVYICICTNIYIYIYIYIYICMYIYIYIYMYTYTYLHAMRKTFYFSKSARYLRKSAWYLCLWAVFFLCTTKLKNHCFVPRFFMCVFSSDFFGSMKHRIYWWNLRNEYTIHEPTLRCYCCCVFRCRYLARNCKTLQHTATHCNTLQHTATHCNTLCHTALDCIALQYTNALHCNTLQYTSTHCNTLQYTATRCNTLKNCNAMRRTATYCTIIHSNALQLTATYCNIY